MTNPKQLLEVHLEALDVAQPLVTFTLKSEGGHSDTFTAGGSMIGALARFVSGIDEQIRRAAAGAAAESSSVTDRLLEPPKVIDLVIDLTGESALLRARTGHGRMVQIELSEELLSRLEERLPAALGELRARRGRRH